jgi:hypothetical protein
MTGSLDYPKRASGNLFRGCCLNCRRDATILLPGNHDRRATNPAEIAAEPRVLQQRPHLPDGNGRAETLAGARMMRSMHALTLAFSRGPPLPDDAALRARYHRNKVIAIAVRPSGWVWQKFRATLTLEL